MNKTKTPQEILESKFINFTDSFEFIVRVKLIEAMEQYANVKLKQHKKMTKITNEVWEDKLF